MSETQLIQAKNVQAYMTGPTDDGVRMGVVLKVDAGLEGFAFSPDDYIRLAGMMVEQSGQLSNDAEKAHRIILSAEAIEFESEPLHSSVVVTGQVGGLRISFSIDGEELLRSLKRFLDARRASRSEVSDGAEKPLSSRAA